MQRNSARSEGGDDASVFAGMANGGVSLFDPAENVGDDARPVPLVEDLVSHAALEDEVLDRRGRPLVEFLGAVGMRQLVVERVARQEREREAREIVLDGVRGLATTHNTPHTHTSTHRTHAHV